MAAVASGITENVRALVEQGANLNERSPNGSLPLIEAARLRNLDILRLLIVSGAELDEVESDLDRTAFHVACGLIDSTLCVELLVRAGCDISMQTEDGETGMQIAQRERNRALVEKLEQLEASPFRGVVVTVQGLQAVSAQAHNGKVAAVHEYMAAAHEPEGGRYKVELLESARILSIKPSNMELLRMPPGVIVKIYATSKIATVVGTGWLQRAVPATEVRTGWRLEDSSGTGEFARTEIGLVTDPVAVAVEAAAERAEAERAAIARAEGDERERVAAAEAIAVAADQERAEAQAELEARRRLETEQKQAKAEKAARKRAAKKRAKAAKAEEAEQAKAQPRTFASVRPATSEEPPDDFLCPISGELMVDPVSTTAGETYERSCIEQWLSKHDTDPSTNKQLTSKDLLVNRTLMRSITQWQDRQEQSLASSQDQPQLEPEPERELMHAPASAAQTTPAPVGPMADFGETEVLRWIGGVGLTDAQLSTVYSLMEKDEYDGSDLVGATVKTLKRLLKGTPAAEEVAQRLLDAIDFQKDIEAAEQAVEAKVADTPDAAAGELLPPRMAAPPSSDPPDQFICPLTMELMEDPVISLPI
jgi:hypothetical protein